MKVKPKIVIDLDRMKYPNTGMHNYCENLFLQFGKNEEVDALFYAHKETPIPVSQKITIKPLDNLFLKAPKEISVWHTTSQLSRRVPISPVKLVLTIHDLNFLYSDKPQWKKERELKRVQKKINRADVITCISYFTKSEIEKHLNIGGKNIIVIPNGVTVQTFPDFDNPKIKPNKKFLFSLGVIGPKKNLLVLIPMLKHCEYDLVIAGKNVNNEYYETLQKLVEANDLQERVHFVNEISEAEKYWYYKNCEAFVFPSKSEGFGLPPVEAMRLGKPVFLSKFTSLPEVGGDIAYYFEDYDPKKMGEFLIQGIKDFENNQKENLSIEWSNQFSWDEIAKKYLEVYLQIGGI